MNLHNLSAWEFAASLDGWNQAQPGSQKKGAPSDEEHEARVIEAEMAELERLDNGRQ